ncbi:MAG: Gfo/Idh/MocA family protein [Tannerella sp.]|uniref:Gfo/Idh/MocA family protein n=1 Tax=Tannerella sp. TaxID=2382127 RepID=UPI003FA28D97
MRNRKLRMGMIGGGINAFIGSIHRCAALMDNEIELVCGCFSRNEETSRQSGRSLYLPDNRVYGNYREMIMQEALLPEEERMDFVAIVTPNKDHYEPAVMSLDAGFDVVLDKPMTFSLEEARSLQQKVKETGRLLALTHTYSGYPAVKEAKARIARGDLGKIRRVYVEYIQGWLTDRVELLGNNNAVWRTDPLQSGKAGCIGDIGTHAWHLSEYITGLRVTELCAELKTFATGRQLDDDGAALLHYDNGATGVLIATQIAAGEENNITVRVYGEKGGLEWRQMEPNTLYAKWPDRPTEEIRVGSGFSGLRDVTRWNTRTPGGHPEGYIEAFANIYRNFARTLRARAAGETPREKWLDFPTVDDGLRGMQFIETMVASAHNNDGKWQPWID